MAETYSVLLEKLIEQMELENVTKDVDVSRIEIVQTDVNRPALQLAGFFDYFDSGRIQIIGHVEHTYMEQKGLDYTLEMMEIIMAGSERHTKPPCIVFCRDLHIDDKLIRLASKYQVPLLRTGKETNAFMAEVIRWLNVELAPRCSVHGVLLDLFGEGVLIMGESGIGKSEVALELIHRGHRLVSDDVVEIKKVSDASLIGSAPDITRHFIELRGIGIIDVKSLFGVECVKLDQHLDLVINLEEWSQDTEYDRLGLEDQYTEFLGNKVVSHNITIRPGRNIAIIVESAAVNHRQKKMGYNAAQELYNRVTQNIMKGNANKEEQ